MTEEKNEDKERKRLVMNDKGLYNWFMFQRKGMTLDEFVKLNRNELTSIINKKEEEKKKMKVVAKGLTTPKYFLPPRGAGLKTGRAGSRRYGEPRTEEERKFRHEKKKELVQLTVMQEKEFPKGMQCVEMTRENYRDVSGKFGNYVTDWHFVDGSTIKYFDKESGTWKYHTISSSKIERVIKKLNEVL